MEFYKSVNIRCRLWWKCLCVLIMFHFITIINMSLLCATPYIQFSMHGFSLSRRCLENFMSYQLRYSTLLSLLLLLSLRLLFFMFFIASLNWFGVECIWLLCSLFRLSATAFCKIQWNLSVKRLITADWVKKIGACDMKHCTQNYKWYIENHTNIIHTTHIVVNKWTKVCAAKSVLECGSV